MIIANLKLMVSLALSSVTIFSVLYIALFMQQVLLLEYHTEREIKQNFLIMVAGSIVLWLFLATSYLAKWDAGYTIGISFCGILIIVLFIINSFKGRKRTKWLAVFEWIPMLGFLDGIITLHAAFLDSANTELPNIIIFCIICAAMFFIVKKKTRFIQILLKDIENRSLSPAEEVLIWLAGIWLIITNEVIDTKLKENTSDFSYRYIVLLNFIIVIVMIVFVITSNYRHYYSKKNSELQRSLIITMADLVESRDDNTGGHIHRTSKYVELIAKKLQEEGLYADILTNEYISNMVVAAPLHDVGKIHIPDSILNKPGKLDDKEYEKIKMHTTVGEQIIDKVEENVGEMEYLVVAKEMAAYHHERIDGTGYPNGIKGEDIPLCSKIMAVADVFDALTSKRCYKEAMSVDQAISIIELETGSHFDPVVVSAFLKCREEIEQLVL